MKRKFFVLFGLLSIGQAFSQITLNRTDFANANDIFTVKVLNQNPLQFIDVSQTGANTTWDYHNLSSAISRTDTFFSPWQTPPVYWLFFNAFNTSFAQKLPNDISVGPFLTISEIYNFYHVNSSKYELTGFGALINNIPTPIKYDQNDVIYRFPINYGDRDTSFSTFDVNIPQIGYWKNEQTRYNYVDGWGTLIIPNDTFEVLRIRSEIHSSDSVHLDTLGGISARTNRPIQVEYKFLTKNGGIPVLKIITQKNILGIETIIWLEYLHVDTPTSILSPLPQHAVLVYPQPAQKQVWIKLHHLPETSFALTLYDLKGNILFQDSLSSSSVYELQNIPPGLYLLTLSNDQYFYSQKIIFHD